MKVKFIGQKLEFATDGSAGMDIRTTFKTIDDFEFFEGGGFPAEGGVFVSPNSRFTLPTNLFVELPEGLEMQIRSRSGLSLKQGLQVVQAPGTIDSDYRGEVKICLVNLSAEEQFIPYNSRVAQAVFAKYEKVLFEEVSKLSNTKRGAGGFGHTGL